jgi:hypothetical protein
MGIAPIFGNAAHNSFSVFEMRIVANKKADAEIKLKLPP